MQTRSTPGVVTFVRPFNFKSLRRELPAGSYSIESDEELLEGVASLIYRRTEVRIFVPMIAGLSEAEMWTISPGEFDAALAADREVRSGIPPAAASEFPYQAMVSREDASRLASARHDQKVSVPFYGSLIGVLALLIATMLLRQS